ncbi:MAG: site-specific integrase [Planctomycetota bacterium]|jgi:site-specific recombinase XerC
MINAVVGSLSVHLAVHLDEYVAWTEARGRTAHYVYTQRDQIEKILKGCGFTQWREIDARQVEAWLAEQRRQGKLKQWTSNHYLIALKSFCLWMVRQGRPTDYVAYDMKAWWEWYNADHVPFKNEQLAEARMADLIGAPGSDGPGQSSGN